MKKLVIGCIAVLLCASLASAATINVDVTTDKAIYMTGETVNWTLWAWASQGDNHGVSLLSATLTENHGEALNQARLGYAPPPKDTTVFLRDCQYGPNEEFTLYARGTIGAPGTLVDVYAAQLPQLGQPGLPQPGDPPPANPYNIGNQGTQLIFAVGSFEVTVGGLHTLSAAITGATGKAANYWKDEYQLDPYIAGSNPVAFETRIGGSTEYQVVPEPATLMLLGLGGIALLRRRS